VDTVTENTTIFRCPTWKKIAFKHQPDCHSTLV